MPAPPEEGVTAVTVHHSSVDKMGVVRQGEYLGWFRRGLRAFLDERGWNDATEEELGVTLQVQGSYLRLHGAAYCDEELALYARPRRVESHRFTMEYRVVRKGDEVQVASGRNTVACVADTGRPRRLPAPLLAAVG